jgi:hypothetical protein
MASQLVVDDDNPSLAPAREPLLFSMTGLAAEWTTGRFVRRDCHQAQHLQRQGGLDIIGELQS